MRHRLTPGPRAARLTPVAAAAVAAAALAAPADAQTTASPISVDAAHDAVTVSGLGFGQATLQVTRPDAATGAPVVIGQFADVASPGTPFTVNTTAPSALNPSGDCWQAGGLSLPGGTGLVPDMLPGDTVAVGGQNVTVAARGFDYKAATGGPIAGCDGVSTWGRNVVESASFVPPGFDLRVSGQAQPLTTGVAVTATDGRTTTPAVDVAPGADGGWAATIPAGALATLAGGSIQVGGVFAVPDVASGAPSHIRGRPFSVYKATPAPAVAPSQPASPAVPAIRLRGLLAPSRISLPAVRAGKLKVSFIVPAAARYVRVRLARPGHTALLVIAPAAKPGTRQTVRLSSAALNRRLVPGRYTVTAGAGEFKMRLGSAVLRRTVLIR
ncbi:hypothetical protein [Candidatus Solirubrobacter pratensis]|uniref:hypothetical protein n=1 Tax=Candidatus Solirubrobacter pratensis TaxID=1298857 RepID=UPI0004076156|nr:hypothetical protein [Candidatus Solirubrobacter pratensis]